MSKSFTSMKALLTVQTCRITINKLHSKNDKKAALSQGKRHDAECFGQ